MLRGITNTNKATKSYTNTTQVHTNTSLVRAFFLQKHSKLWWKYWIVLPYMVSPPVHWSLCLPGTHSLNFGHRSLILICKLCHSVNCTLTNDLSTCCLSLVKSLSISCQKLYQISKLMWHNTIWIRASHKTKFIQRIHFALCIMKTSTHIIIVQLEVWRPSGPWLLAGDPWVGDWIVC